MIQRTIANLKDKTIPKKTLVDMHVHTNQSPCGKITLEETLIELVGLVNAITITDHDIVAKLPEAVLKGLEAKYQIKVFNFSVEITTSEGDLLAYGISSAPSINSNVEEVIEMIHLEGGIVAAAHPFSINGLGELIYELELDAIELNGSISGKSNQQAKAAAQALSLPLIGGSDSHTKSQVGTCVTEFPTIIRSIKDLIKAVKKGKCRPLFLKHQ